MSRPAAPLTPPSHAPSSPKSCTSSCSACNRCSIGEQYEPPSSPSPEAHRRAPEPSTPSNSIRLEPFDSPFTPGRQRTVSHPYARLYAQREWQATSKSRRPWTHALEPALFTREELTSMRAAHRRPVYIASLEAHVDRLHAQLIERGLYPVAFAELAPFKGMSSKVVKSTVAGLQTDAHFIRSKQTEIERTNLGLRNALNIAVPRYDEDVPDFRAMSPRSATLLPMAPDARGDRAFSVPTQ